MTEASPAGPAILVPLLVLVLVGTGPSAPVGASGNAGGGFDVSLGDSYAAGYQPVARAMLRIATPMALPTWSSPGPDQGRSPGLRNFACDGATSTSMLRQHGCALPAPGPDTAPYPTGRRLRPPSSSWLATLGRSGSSPCPSAATTSSVARGRHPAACISAALTGIERTCTSSWPACACRRTRGPIVGPTYPDVFLGLYPRGSAQKSLARLDSGFRDLLNPALASQYRAIGATFVDVTGPWVHTPSREMRRVPTVPFRRRGRRCASPTTASCKTCTRQPGLRPDRPADCRDAARGAR